MMTKNEKPWFLDGDTQAKDDDTEAKDDGKGGSGLYDYVGREEVEVPSARCMGDDVSSNRLLVVAERHGVRGGCDL